MLKIYVAGKISKESSFGTHHWRDAFVDQLSHMSGLSLKNIDPLASENDSLTTLEIFQKDCRLIKQCNIFIVNLTDDISVGGSQEILIARYFKKPVIGLAPKGGKFNEATREMFGKTVTNYKDPFVFTTCDIVCSTVEEIAEILKNPLPISSGLDILDI